MRLKCVQIIDPTPPAGNRSASGRAGCGLNRPETVERAFEVTFGEIKPNDAVIVGMYPEYEDQPAVNAEYVRRFGHLSGE